MKKHIAIITAAVLLLCSIFSLSACVGKEPLKAGPFAVIHESKFGGVYVEITIDDFLALGFDFGDSIDVAFSNGYELKELPFYNGYYTRAGQPLIVGYPGYPYIDVCVNYGSDLYETAGLDEKCTAVLTMHEKGAYIATSNVMSMKYTNERSDYASDEAFANFRPMSGGQLSNGLFFRAASPCDNQYSRASYSSALCEQAGISYILDLADNTDEAQLYYSDDGLNCPYWKSLYENDRIALLDMSANYRTESYANSFSEGLRRVISEEGPFLIHCTEGKDRTGFVCLVIEALAGASLEELESDYMKTYDNYYGVTEESAAEYNAVRDLKFNDMVFFICGVEEISELSPDALFEGAVSYLRFGGMSQDEIDALILKITQ